MGIQADVAQLFQALAEVGQVGDLPSHCLLKLRDPAGQPPGRRSKAAGQRVGGVGWGGKSLLLEEPCREHRASSPPPGGSKGQARGWGLPVRGRGRGGCTGHRLLQALQRGSELGREGGSHLCAAGESTRAGRGPWGL